MSGDSAVANDWWNANLPRMMPHFEHWLGSPGEPHRVAARRMIEDAGYKSVLDCGCGLCTAYDGFRLDGYQVDYLGMDTCRTLVGLAQRRGIPAVMGDAENIPGARRGRDVVLCDSVLEHLGGWRRAMASMVDAAKNEVLVVWFIRPGEKEILSSVEEKGVILRHNRYCRSDIDAWARERSLVIRWVPLDDKFEALRILRVAP